MLDETTAVYVDGTELYALSKLYRHTTNSVLPPYSIRSVHVHSVEQIHARTVKHCSLFTALVNFLHMQHHICMHRF